MIVLFIACKADKLHCIVKLTDCSEKLLATFPLDWWLINKKRLRVKSKDQNNGCGKK